MICRWRFCFQVVVMTRGTQVSHPFWRTCAVESGAQLHELNGNPLTQQTLHAFSWCRNAGAPRVSVKGGRCPYPSQQDRVGVISDRGRFVDPVARFMLADISTSRTHPSSRRPHTNDATTSRYCAAVPEHMGILSARCLVAELQLTKLSVRF